MKLRSIRICNICII